LRPVAGTGEHISQTRGWRQAARTTHRYMDRQTAP
jgi:hypothetical protein